MCPLLAVLVVFSFISLCCLFFFFFFFFNDTATTEIYTLSLHDALPILSESGYTVDCAGDGREGLFLASSGRSEEHTSELQSHSDLVCRLLLEKKKKKKKKKKKIKTNNETNHII